MVFEKNTKPRTPEIAQLEAINAQRQLLKRRRPLAALIEKKQPSQAEDKTWSDNLKQHKKQKTWVASDRIETL